MSPASPVGKGSREIKEKLVRLLAMSRRRVGVWKNLALKLLFTTIQLGTKTQAIQGVLRISGGEELHVLWEMPR